MLYDDRDERPGAEFATLDLIGLPWQIIVGSKGLAENKVELKTARQASGPCCPPRTPFSKSPDDDERQRCHARCSGSSIRANAHACVRAVRVDARLALFARARSGGFVSVIAALSFLGIALGVATLIVVMSVMNGFHKELLDKIVGINGHLFVQAADPPFSDYRDVVKRVSAVSGVTLAIPMLEGAAGVSSPYNQAGALLRGIREADLKRLPGIAGNVRAGSLDAFDSGTGVAIGQRMAENLSLRVGDTITLLSAKGANTPFGIAPRIKAYPVVAIFRSACRNSTASSSTCRWRTRKTSSTRTMK